MKSAIALILLMALLILTTAPSMAKLEIIGPRRGDHVDCKFKLYGRGARPNEQITVTVDDNHDFGHNVKDMTDSQGRWMLTIDLCGFEGGLVTITVYAAGTSVSTTVYIDGPCNPCEDSRKQWWRE
jgi:hypothetical protein